MLSHRTKNTIRRITLALIQFPVLHIAILSMGLPMVFPPSMTHYRLWQLHYIALFATVAAGIATSIWYTRTLFRVTFAAAAIATLAGLIGMVCWTFWIGASLWALSSFLYLSILFRCRPTKQVTPAGGTESA